MLLSEIDYISAGLFTSQGKWVHPHRIIDSCEVILVMEGEFSIEEAGNIYHLRKNDVLILDKNIPHGGAEETGERVSFFWVHFPDMPSDIVLPKHFSCNQPFAIVLLFRQLLHYDNAGIYPQNAKNLALQLLLTEINVQYIGTGVHNSALINQICEWIRINASQSISVSDISEHFKYNKDYIARILKNAGLPGTKQLIVKYKLDRAKYLLLSTDLGLKEISSEIGFENYLEFLKFFKYHEHMSPTEFRNIYSSIHFNKK